VDCKFSRRLDWNFDLLLVFKEREGHMRVPAKHQESGADNLGAWLANQRLLYRLGVSGDRQKWLEVAEDVTWESRKDQSLIMMHKTKELARWAGTEARIQLTPIEHTGERKFVATSRRSRTISKVFVCRKAT
jgi:hypothetical protein